MTFSKSCLWKEHETASQTAGTWAEILAELPKILVLTLYTDRIEVAVSDHTPSVAMELYVTLRFLNSYPALVPALKPISADMFLARLRVSLISPDFSWGKWSPSILFNIHWGFIEKSKSVVMGVVPRVILPLEY